MCVLFLACCLTLPAQAEGDIVANKIAIQAAFLYNFALFTDWPSLPNDEFNICVMADERMLDALASSKLKQLKERTVSIKNIDDVAQVNTCQILFVGHSRLGAMKDITDRIGIDPVLVISEEDGNDPGDVLIALGVQQDRIVFKVNRTLAAKRSLNFSSKLLKLAIQVY